MEPVITATLASGVVALLTPYLKKAAEGAATQAGKAAWAATATLYGWVKSHFARTPNTEAALEALESAPENEVAQAAVRVHLEQLILTDDKFRVHLAALLKQADEAGADGVFHTNIHGNVQKLIQVGVVQGDINL